MLWETRDSHLHFRELFVQQLLSKAGVAESCMSKDSHPYSTRFTVLVQPWDTSSHFSLCNFLESHLTTQVRKRDF